MINIDTTNHNNVGNRTRDHNYYNHCNTSHDHLQNDIVENYIGKMNVLCAVCKAKHFQEKKVPKKDTFDDCCNHGKVILETLPEFPKELKSLFNNSHVKSNHFFNFIRLYNNSFSFAS